MVRKTNRVWLALLLLAALILFGWGLLSVSFLRFEQGDTYSPYSSLRADPLGSRGLYGVIDRLSGVSVERHLRPLSKLEGGSGQLVLVLGLPATALELGNDNLEEQLLRLAEAGSRVVVAARPPGEWMLRGVQHDQEEAAEQARQAESDEPEATGDEAGGDKADEKSDEETDEAADAKTVDWGLTFTWLPVQQELAQLYTATRADNVSGLPDFLDFHTPLVMEPASDWRPIYNHGAQAVVAERQWGQGSLVVFVDAFLFSNESLRSRSETELLLWTLGDTERVVFAEAHLGVVDTPGLMSLMRRYRMHGILLALFLVAALAVWKNAVPLVPPPPPVEGGVAARDHFSGLVNLLQRHVPLADLPEACHREWLRSLPRYGFPGEEKRRQIRELVKQEMQRPAKERRPLTLYREISRILTERTI